MLKEQLNKMKPKEKRKLAEKIKCTYRHVEMMRTGNRLPGKDIIVRIADYFGWNLEDLILSLYDIPVVRDVGQMSHSKLVMAFHDKPLARNINLKLLKIESLDPIELKRIDKFIDTTLEMLEDKTQPKDTQQQPEQSKEIAFAGK